jgi:elongation factor Ts
MTIRRAAHLAVGAGVIASYMHNQVADGLGKIGVIVALESTGSVEALNELGKKIAQHIAAINPLALDSTGIAQDVVDREKAVLAEKNGAGKPPHVVEKIVESGLKSFFKENCLVDQVSIHADHAGKTVGQVVKEGAGIGAPVELKAFVRYALGEGIEKETSDFAAEVAAAASGQA